MKDDQELRFPTSSFWGLVFKSLRIGGRKRDLEDRKVVAVSQEGYWVETAPLQMRHTLSRCKIFASQEDQVNIVEQHLRRLLSIFVHLLLLSSSSYYLVEGFVILFV